MICPKCLSIESDGGSQCRKCGAQLYTGVFPKPVAPDPAPSARDSSGTPSPAPASNPLRATFIALLVFSLAAAALVLLLSRLQTAAP